MIPWFLLGSRVGPPISEHPLSEHCNIRTFCYQNGVPPSNKCLLLLQIRDPYVKCTISPVRSKIILIYAVTVGYKSIRSRQVLCIFYAKLCNTSKKENNSESIFKKYFRACFNTNVNCYFLTFIAKQTNIKRIETYQLCWAVEYFRDQLYLVKPATIWQPWLAILKQTVSFIELCLNKWIFVSEKWLFCYSKIPLSNHLWLPASTRIGEALLYVLLLDCIYLHCQNEGSWALWAYPFPPALSGKPWTVMW